MSEVSVICSKSVVFLLTCLKNMRSGNFVGGHVRKRGGCTKKIFYQAHLINQHHQKPT